MKGLGRAGPGWAGGVRGPGRAWGREGARQGLRA